MRSSAFHYSAAGKRNRVILEIPLRSGAIASIARIANHRWRRQNGWSVPGLFFNGFPLPPGEITARPSRSVQKVASTREAKK